MDVLFDYIDVSTFWTLVLTAHGLASVALLGALTHQAMAVCRTANAPAADTFVARFRGVAAQRYAGAVCVLWVITFVFGAWIYTKYRIHVRVPIEHEGFWKTLGAFELKEHLTTFGLAALPLYWYLWKHARTGAFDSARKWLTVWLAGVCWYAFVVGHLVNNVRGFGG